MMLFRVHKKASLFLAALFLSAAGCNLEGLDDLPNLPGDENNGSAESVDIEGVIVDGYMQGAHVFLDLNGNQMHDDDEPSATSDENGAFKLHVASFDREEFAAAFLQAEVPDTAKDSDDMGRTLREAGKKGFTLLSPASALLDEVDSQANASGEQPDAFRAPVKGAVLSPLSTLVVGEMIERGIPLAEAKAAVQTALGLPGKELLHDFVANPDAVLHNVARAAAVSLGEAAASAKGGAADASVMARPGMQVVDAVRSVKEQLPQVIDALDLRSDTTTTASVDRVKAEFAEQMKRADEARATAADAGVRLLDPNAGKPVAGAATGANGEVRVPDMTPPMATNPMAPPSAADAGVRLPEPPKTQSGAPGDAGSSAPRPVEPPLMVPPPKVEGPSGTTSPADGGVRPPEVQPGDAGVRPDAGYPVYPPQDAGVAYRK